MKTPHISYYDSVEHHSKNADKIISEKDLSQELLSYIYSDEFEDNLNRAYKDVWDRFEEEVSYSKIDKINEKFGFNKNIVLF